MAAFGMTTNPMELTISEPSTLQLGSSVVELTLRVVSGTIQVNTKAVVGASSPEYAEGAILILKDTNELHLDGNGVVVVEI